MNVLHYFGSGVLVVLLAMVIVSLIHARKVSTDGVVGYGVVVVVILLMLLRT